jgi:hypothetical protein
LAKVFPIFVFDAAEESASDGALTLRAVDFYEQEGCRMGINVGRLEDQLLLMSAERTPGREF